LELTDLTGITDWKKSDQSSYPAGYAITTLTLYIQTTEVIKKNAVKVIWRFVHHSVLWKTTSVDARQKFGDSAEIRFTDDYPTGNKFPPGN